jgi:hypothetical protein
MYISISNTTSSKHFVKKHFRFVEFVLTILENPVMSRKFAIFLLKRVYNQLILIHTLILRTNEKFELIPHDLVLF